MQDKNWLVGIVAIFALVGVIVFVPKPQPTVVLVTTAGAEKAEITKVDQSEAVFGLSQKASKFTDVEVTNELLVRGPSSVSGAATFAGNVNLSSTFEQGGSVTELTGVATSTLTAAQICDSSLLTVAPVTTTPTITFPATTTLFADCLTSNGQFKDLTYKSITTSTIIAAGTGGTLGFSSSATVAAGKTAIIRVLRNSATTYLLELVNVLN